MTRADDPNGNMPSDDKPVDGTDPHNHAKPEQQEKRDSQEQREQKVEQKSGRGEDARGVEPMELADNLAAGDAGAGGQAGVSADAGGGDERVDGADVVGPMPLLPLRDIIVFPCMVSQLFVGRDRSIAALQQAMSKDKLVFLAAQKNAKTNTPEPEDIFDVGTVAEIQQLLRLPDGTVKVLVLGKYRARVVRFEQTEPFFWVVLSAVQQVPAQGSEVDALVRSIQSSFDAYVKLSKKIQPEVLAAVQAIEDSANLVDTILSHLGSIKLVDRQMMLEMVDVGKRLHKLLELLHAEIEILQVERKIRSRVKKQMERTQKEYYLNEQMQAIQKELGADRDEFRSEMQELEALIATKKLSKEARERVAKEMKKMRMMHPTSAEATVVRNYIDWILALPWGNKTQESFDLDKAEAMLDEDHYGLKNVKERIIEYLAVQALTRKLKGPILCFVGPPGVGKTSLAKSIARATGRAYVRISLGGVRDEAEIRGHRRTYIGALPGKIIQSLKKAGTSNPLILLDEVDKMSADFRGDPASALLEVLDGEQNFSFNDHYLDLDYDLSDVMFITTANTLKGIPVPLQDRMEIIELSGYTEFEKVHIAQSYLLPRQRTDCGLENVQMHLTEGAIRTLIHHYTRESGVRGLEREIASICRKIARKVVAHGPEQQFEINARAVPQFLGVPKFQLTKGQQRDEIGLCNGLAVTSHGGDLLACEVTLLHGKGKVVITGLLEKGMEESAQAALSYVRSRAAAWGHNPEFYQKHDVHIHFPEFVPKDGPSAGVTIATSLASALLQVPVRKDVAMTGELTLRGRVLGIGGLREKLLAAFRVGIETVVIPKENRKDLKDVPRRVLRGLRVVLASNMDDVLREALVVASPRALFGPARGVIEYAAGELVVRDDEPTGGQADAEQVPCNNAAGVADGACSVV